MVQILISHGEAKRVFPAPTRVMPASQGKSCNSMPCHKSLLPLCRSIGRLAGGEAEHSVPGLWSVAQAQADVCRMSRNTGKLLQVCTCGSRTMTMRSVA